MKKSKKLIRSLASLLLISIVSVSCFCGCEGNSDSKEEINSSLISSCEPESETSGETSETSKEEIVDNSTDENSKDDSLDDSSEISTVVSENTQREESSDDVQSKEPSSEEFVSKDPFEPLTPIPKELHTDSIDSYFDDSVFIGYSIIMHFGKYVSQWRIEVDESIMGDSIFCCGVGMNFTKNRTQTPETKNNVLPKYQGNSYNFEDLPKATGSDTIYIGLMGFSELKNSTIDNCVNYSINEAIAGIERIKSKDPTVNVVILSSTYNTGTYATGELDPVRITNENIRLYNIGVLEYCNENGIDFIDVSTPMLDGRGFMPVKYASDRDYHIKKAPFKIWVNIFRDYARKKQNGTWQNISFMPPLVAE